MVLMPLRERRLVPPNAEVALFHSLPVQMSNQKRQVLKDKFKGFNTELEELHKIQKDWSLPDHVLRSRVRNDNVELIVPLYTIFHER